MAANVVIVGGGVSGALTAYHLILRVAHRRVIIVDSREKLGLGLAYSTPSLGHLLNVPAGKISGIEDQPDHFVKWLRAHYDEHATAEMFAPRAVFGRYIRSMIEPLDGLEHIRATVIDCECHADRTVLKPDNGRPLSAFRVVLATGNLAPARLRGLSPSAVETGAYHHNTWDAGFKIISRQTQR